MSDNCNRQDLLDFSESTSKLKLIVLALAGLLTALSDSLFHIVFVRLASLVDFYRLRSL